MRTSADSGRRGAVIIETALVTPLLLVILVGIVEMAFLMRDDAAVSSLVHQGVRTASSALATDHEQSHQASQFCTAPCSVDNAPALADLAVAAIEHADASLPKDAIDELWIYKANPQGFPGAAGNTRFASCETACVVYRWSAEHHTFDYVSGSWRADDIDACPDSQDTVGVYMKATHSLLTGLISRGINITDHAVYSFAALEPTHCSRSTS